MNIYTQLNRFWCFLNKHINFRMGSLSGMVTGSIVFVINANHGFVPAFSSFLKQFAFNLLMAGYNIRTCQKIVNKIDNKTLSLSLASIVPTIQAFIMLFAVHYFGGTPKPLASTLWQVVGNLFFFFSMAIAYKNNLSKPNYSFARIAQFLKIRTYLKSKRTRRLADRKKEAS